MEKVIPYITEFVAIVAHCVKEQRGQQISPDRYAVDKPLLVGLLDKNKYEEADAKLQLWKALNWIDTDKQYLTKHIYLKEEKTHRRMIVFDLSVHDALSRLS